MTMIGDWRWDETLFEGSAPYYERGRLPYPPALADAFAEALALDGRGRLLDVGCGPGTVALRLAHLFEQVVGVDADAGMLAEAAGQADAKGILNATWLHARAEDIAAAGSFRAATFASSFHWMDRDRVAALMFDLLEPGGAFVQVSTVLSDPGTATEVTGELPHPEPPREAIAALVREYLGPERRAGQGICGGTPGNEAAVLERAGFAPARYVIVSGQQVVVRATDDVVAWCFSNSASAPHLFGDQMDAFEADLRLLLADVSPAGLFAERTPDIELRIWRTQS